MYGLVNQSFRNMIIGNYGDSKWEDILQQVNSDGVFEAMDQYPDEMTGEILMAACGVLDKDPGSLLEEVGYHWTTSAINPYKNMFEMSGDTFVEFVKNLNDLHTRVGSIMPDLIPPSFHVTDETESSFLLHYHSKRDGLWPMVLGLIQGLGARFDTKIEIEHLRGKEDGLDHDEFMVNYQA